MGRTTSVLYHNKITWVYNVRYSNKIVTDSKTVRSRQTDMLSGIETDQLPHRVNSL